jgi:tartrate dehydrogenase/decarboxylase/D-malate dehydrogenase
VDSLGARKPVTIPKAAQKWPASREPNRPEMQSYRIAVIPGDGIGQEVVPEGIRVLDAAGARYGVRFDWETFDWSCRRYAQTGAMMPGDGLDTIREHDAIFLGAVGFPGVPDHISLWGLLIPIRRRFRQYVNLRPVRLMPGIASPLAGRRPGDIDFWIVRENNEGEYSSVGGRFNEGTDDEIVIQETIFSRRGIDRVLRYAFDLAQSRPKRHLTSATKSNGIAITMPYWDERVAAMAADYPEVRVDQYHIDILAAHFVAHPDWFDVVVGSNLFGDILSDLGPAATGTIGIAPSANLNPEREFPSMFEPVHGSAPDIAGKFIANPIGQIWSGAMMLEHLGHPDAAAAVIRAIETVLAGGPRTRDIGGTAGTQDVGRAIAAAVASSASIAGVAVAASEHGRAAGDLASNGAERDREFFDAQEPRRESEDRGAGTE